MIDLRAQRLIEGLIFGHKVPEGTLIYLDHTPNFSALSPTGNSAKCSFQGQTLRIEYPDRPEAPHKVISTTPKALCTLLHFLAEPPDNDLLDTLDPTPDIYKWLKCSLPSKGPRFTWRDLDLLPDKTLGASNETLDLRILQEPQGWAVTWKSTGEPYILNPNLSQCFPRQGPQPALQTALFLQDAIFLVETSRILDTTNGAAIFRL